MANNPIYTNPYRHPEDTGVHVVSRRVTLGMLRKGPVPIGAAEINAIPLRAGVRIVTAFNPSGAVIVNELTLGREGLNDAFITAANAGAGTVGTKEGTGVELGVPRTGDTVFQARYNDATSTTAATAGEAILWVEYIVPRTPDPRTRPAV